MHVILLSSLGSSSVHGEEAPDTVTTEGEAHEPPNSVPLITTVTGVMSPVAPPGGLIDVMTGVRASSQFGPCHPEKQLQGGNVNHCEELW